MHIYNQVSSYSSTTIFFGFSRSTCKIIYKNPLTTSEVVISGFSLIIPLSSSILIGFFFIADSTQFTKSGYESLTFFDNSINSSTNSSISLSVKV